METSVEPTHEVLGIPVCIEGCENISVYFTRELEDTIKESIYKTLQHGCPIESITIDKVGVIHHNILPLYAGVL